MKTSTKIQPTTILVSSVLTFALTVPIFVFAGPSAGLTPNSPFYIFDILVEKISLTFTFNTEKKAQKALSYAEERIEEAKVLIEKKKPKAIERAIEGYESRIALASKKSKEVEDKVRAKTLLVDIAEKANDHQEFLVNAFNEAPEEIKSAVEKAVQASIRGYEQALNEISELRKEVDELERRLEELQAQGAESQNSEIEALKREIEALKLQQNRQQTLEQKTTKESFDLRSVVNSWSRRVARIECQFSVRGSNIKQTLERGNINTDTQKASGSGFLITESLEGGDVLVVTNSHVLTGHNGFSVPDYCQISFLNGQQYFISDDSLVFLSNPEVKFIGNIPYVVFEQDFGNLKIENPDTYIKNLAQDKSICATNPQVGDEILILGYPGIGSSSGITATEGIISGIDGDFYITSAKVERGNSGGAAIFIEENCYFGVPTFAISGEIESLARILDIKKTWIAN